MLQTDLIEPAQSEWMSNVVMIRSADGSLRFCVDYRQQNERTIKDAYPLPRIDVCLDASWFSTFDLRSEYYQVEMDPRDEDKTTFASRRGPFRFKVMQFGLCNAPATFQRLMNVALAELNPVVCLVYLDDMIVHSVDLESHYNPAGETYNETGSIRFETEGVQVSATPTGGGVSGASSECRRSLYRPNEGGCGG